MTTSASMASKWKPKLRNYDDEKVGHFVPVLDGKHPLKTNVVAEKPKSNGFEPLGALDPLSKMAHESSSVGVPVEIDPLSAMSAPSIINDSFKSRTASVGSVESVKPSVITKAEELWFSKRNQVLNTYTTREKIAIRTAVLSAKDNIKEVVIQAEKLKAVDRIQQRLEELNDFDESSKTECVSVTVEEYLSKITDVNSMLTAAWRDEQRVKAVRLAIQCTKMLNDTSVVEFYPSKFVLITDILDNFGNLVFDRLLAKAESVGRSLPESFRADDVPNAAKETTLNWFYKLASIRELLPRIFMQAAILQSLRFISNKPLEEWIDELMMMSRGISNPLVSLYTSAYLCRVGLRAYYLQKSSNRNSSMTILGKDSSIFSKNANCLPAYLRKCIEDFFLISRQVAHLNFERLPKDDNITLLSYVRLFIPALDWIFLCVSSFAEKSNSSSLLACEILEAVDGHPNSDLIIHCLLSSFPSSFVSEKGFNIASAIGNMKKPDIPKWQLFIELGRTLLISEPMYSDRQRIFELSWSCVTDKQHLPYNEALQPKDMFCWAEIWLEYSAKFLNMSCVDDVLGLVVENCEKIKHGNEVISSTLHLTLSKLIYAVGDFESLFSTKNFLKFIECFNFNSSCKSDACQLVVEAYGKSPMKPLSVQVFIDSFLYLCKTWHDSAVSYHSSPEVARQIAKSINLFISRVDFGRDFEKLLQFYMECRSTFVYLEHTTAHLIVMVNRAVMNVSSVVKMKHTKRTLNFVKAAIAFCYITVPSIDDPLKQVRLSILTAETALVNGCIGQAEALFKLAVTTLTEVPISTLGTDGRQHPTDQEFACLVAHICGALIPLPDSPNLAPLFMWQGLIKATVRYDWLGAAGIATSSSTRLISSGDTKIDALLSILHSLSSLGQPKYIYRVSTVDANDVLYGSDKRFLARLNELTVEVLTELIKDLENRSETVHSPKQRSGSNQALVNYQNLIAHVASSLLPLFDVKNENEDLVSFANRLCQLGGKNNQKLLKLKDVVFSRNAQLSQRIFA